MLKKEYSEFVESLSELEYDDELIVELLTPAPRRKIDTPTQLKLKVSTDFNFGPGLFWHVSVLGVGDKSITRTVNGLWKMYEIEGWEPGTFYSLEELQKSVETLLKMDGAGELKIKSLPRFPDGRDSDGTAPRLGGFGASRFLDD